LSAVIVTSGGPLSALAAKAATTTIPILFVSRDPVQDGLVGGACTGFGESRFTPGYASFLRTVPRAGVIRQGRVNPMQFAGLDGPLAELIPPCTDPARVDAPSHFRPYLALCFLWVDPSRAVLHGRVRGMAALSRQS